MLFEIKKTIFIYGIILICILISVFSIFGRFETDSLKQEMKKTVESKELISYFDDIYYYKVESLAKKMVYVAKNLVFDNADYNSQSILPVGEVYSKDGEIVNYSAGRSIYNPKKYELTFESDVIISTKNLIVTSNKAKYHTEEEIMTNWGNVKSDVTDEKNGDKIIVFSDEVVSRPYKKTSKFSGDVHGYIKRKKIYEERINFKSQQLLLDLNAYTAELITDVYLQKGGLEARAKRGEIYLDNYNKNLKYYVLYDDVKMLEKLTLKNGTSFVRTGFAEKVEGIVSEDKVILSGNPKVFQVEDVIKGNRITLRENSEVIEIDDAITNFILK